MKALSVLTLALLPLFVTSGLRADEKVGSDGKFLQDAASGGMLEVKLGQLAIERAQNPEVRQFAQRMVTDHTRANKELMAVAETNGIAISRDLNKKDQDIFDMFSDLKGPEFDRFYMNRMVKDHEQDVGEFMKESKSAQNNQVRDFATRTLPTLQEHLRLAREVAAKVGGSQQR